MTRKNPWRGLASYEEPQGNEQDYLFCGRDEETLDMVRLIENNLFVTLYGSSGIGKTSLLKAGVIPILRRKDYFPLYVRLSQEDNNISYAEAIVNKLRNSGLHEERGAALDHADGNDRLYLWSYFATTRFRNSDGREVYPVIILDQFEEVFRDADKRKAELLLKQIYLLLNDELEMPAADGYSADTNYRFVASIREDFLFVLEDSIDENSLDLYKNNRYRLRPMKPENARQVVLVPGKDCIDEVVKEDVADRLVSLARRKENNDIDTILLSLVCAGTFDKKAGEEIDYSDLDVWKDNPMQVYYHDAVKSLSVNQIRYIQNNLVRDDGSRRRVDVKEVCFTLGENTYNTLLTGRNRILSLTEKEQVELLHDQLALAVYEERKAFDERERKKAFREKVLYGGFIVFFVILVFIVQIKELKKQRHELEIQRWIATKGQTLFLAEKSKNLYNDGDHDLAELLLLETFPNSYDNKPTRPYVAEAEQTLRSLLCNYTEIFKFNHDKEYYDNNTATINKIKVYYATFLNSDKVASVANNTINIWGINSDHLIKVLHMDSLPEYIKEILDRDHESDIKERALYDNQIQYIIGDGDHIEAVSKFGSCRYWNILESDKMLIFDQWHNQDFYIFKDSDYFNTAFTIDTKSYLRSFNIQYGGNAIHIHEPEDISFKERLRRRVHITKYHYRELKNYHHGTINWISIKPSNDQFITASSDSTIIVWDVLSGQRINSLVGHNGGVNSAIYSSDGKYIVSASDDGTVKVWHAESGVEISTFVGHQGRVLHAEFGNKDRYIVSASDDGTIRLWEFPPLQELIDEVRKHLDGRKLTDEERRMYYLE